MGIIDFLLALKPVDDTGKYIETYEGGYVMKKNLAKKVTLSILAGAVLMSSSVVWAATAPSGWKDSSVGGIYIPETGTEGSVSVDGTYDVSLAGVAKGAGDATSGKVTISGGTFYGYVYGGITYGGNATVNAVNITGGTFYDYVYGGFALSGEANENTVTISDGSIEGKLIYGGYCMSGAGASNNIVTISGGVLRSGSGPSRLVDVYGGYVDGTIGNATSSNDNTVNIGGSANLEYANLYGSNIDNSSGNILNIGTDSTPWQATNTGKSDGTLVQNKVSSIQGFDTINFNNIAWQKGGTVVQTTDLELNSTKITANIKSGTLTEETEMMNLIQTENDIVGKIAADNTVNVGIAKSYTGAITQEDKAIVITLTGTPSSSDPEEGGNTTPQPSRNDQVLVLGESRAAAVAFTNQGSELIETGLNALARDNEKDTKVFAAVYGNHSEYETGSHVNVNGWSGIVGIGKTNDNGLTVGAFFENGEGNYSTHNIFTDDYIRGDGEACYNGGGFLVRKDNANGVYAEASLRAGNLQNELRNAVRNGSELTGYDIDTFYYGAHVGIGKVIPRGNDGDSLDVYGKFIYTHHDGETFDIGGTATKFDSVESERLRLGFRINEVQTNKLSMYYGAAWEYEFNGDAHDKIASFDLETPSLEGSTVIGEIGAHYKASDKWSIDLNGRAYVGQREGFSGSVQANYAF